MQINTGVFTALFQEGRLVVDGVLVVVVYYTAMNIIKLRDEVKDLKMQLFGTSQLPGALPELKKDVEDMQDILYPPTKGRRS